MGPLTLDFKKRLLDEMLSFLESPELLESARDITRNSGKMFDVATPKDLQVVVEERNVIPAQYYNLHVLLSNLQSAQQLQNCDIETVFKFN